MDHEWTVDPITSQFLCKHCSEPLIHTKNYYGLVCPMRLVKGAVELLSFGPVKYSAFIRCECGSEKVGSPRHSEYCPKYIMENK